MAHPQLQVEISIFTVAGRGLRYPLSALRNTMDVDLLEDPVVLFDKFQVVTTVDKLP